MGDSCLSLKAKIIGVMRHTGFQRYFKNTSWLMLERLLRIMSGLIVGIWVARYLGPHKYGLFSYALAFTAIFGAVAKLGLDGLLVRELVGDYEKRDVYLGTAFWLKVVGAFVAMGLMAIIVPFTSNDPTTNSYIFIIAVGLIFQSFGVIEFYFQSQVLARLVTFCKVSQLALSAVIKIYLLVNDADLIWFVLVTVFDSVSLALCYIVAYYLRKNPPFYMYFDFGTATRLLKDSWPLIFASIVIIIYMRIDQIMIKAILDEHEVGIYSAAVRLSEAFYFLPVLITASVFPAILNARKTCEGLYKSRLQRLYTFMVWTAIAIALPVTILSEHIVILTFGKEYQESGVVLMIHSWAAIFVFLGVTFDKYLLAENLTKIAFQRTLLGAICNVLLNLWLIPVYGVEGAAWATLISQCIANLGYDLFDKRLHQQFKMKMKGAFMPWLMLR